MFGKRSPSIQRWCPAAGRPTSRSSVGGRSSRCSVRSPTRCCRGRSAIVAVTGEAGIGKSRLVHEVVSPLAGVPSLTRCVLEGACAPYGESNVWWPVAGAALTRLGLDRSNGPEDARQRIVRQLSVFDELQPGTPQFDRIVELILHLVGQPSALDALGPIATRDAVVAAVVSGLRARASRSPVVIWVDDVQWAAPVMLELLESVARQLSGLPVLVVTTCRPDGDSPVDWPPPVDPALDVAPLDRTAGHTRVGHAGGRRGRTRAARRGDRPDHHAQRRQPVVPHRVGTTRHSERRRDRRPAAGFVAGADRGAASTS